MVARHEKADRQSRTDLRRTAVRPGRPRPLHRPFRRKRPVHTPAIPAGLTHPAVVPAAGAVMGNSDRVEVFANCKTADEVDLRSISRYFGNGLLVDKVSR